MHININYIKMKYIFKLLLLLIFFSCSENSSLKDKLLTKENEFWIIDDFSEVGHLYGYKFESNRYAYYIISPTNRVYNRYNPNAEGKYYITKDSIIQYYYPNCKISILNDTILEIIHNKGNIHKFKKIKYVDFKELEYVMW